MKLFVEIEIEADKVTSVTDAGEVADRGSLHPAERYRRTSSYCSRSPYFSRMLVSMKLAW